MHPIGLWTSLLGCGTSPAEPETRPPSHVLTIEGTPSLLADFVPALTETHHRTRGSLTFDTTSTSTPQAMRRLLDGDTDVVVTNREAEPHEEERARAAGWSFHDDNTRHVVGVDVIEIRTHVDNPVTSLSYDQLIGIFCQGTVNDWVFVDGPERAPVNAFVPPAPSGLRTAFEDFFCGTHGMHSTVTDATGARIREKLADDVNAIAVVSASVDAGHAVGLRPDPLGQPVLPTQANVVSGAYPLRLDVLFYTSGPAAGYARSFLDWVQSPAGQEVVDEQGFVPKYLRPAEFDEPRPLREMVHFDATETRPNARSQARLKLLVDEIRDRGLDHVVLEGFTDNREENAEELSLERAEAVKRLLERQIQGLDIEVQGRAEAAPLMPNDTPYGRGRNRRVQVTIVDDGADAVVADAEAEP